MENEETVIDPVDPVEDPIDPPLEDPVTDPVDPPPEDPVDPPAWTVEDVQKLFDLPLHEQIQKNEKSTADLLTEFKKLNDYLIPTKEELAEQEAKDAEQAALEEGMTDYDPLILEQLEILNAHMEESVQIQNDSKIISAETGILLAVTLMVAIGVKVFVDQVTKW